MLVSSTTGALIVFRVFHPRSLWKRNRWSTRNKICFQLRVDSYLLTRRRTASRTSFRVSCFNRMYVASCCIERMPHQDVLWLAYPLLRGKTFDPNIEFGLCSICWRFVEQPCALTLLQSKRCLKFTQLLTPGMKVLHRFPVSLACQCCHLVA